MKPVLESLLFNQNFASSFIRLIPNTKRPRARYNVINRFKIFQKLLNSRLKRILKRRHSIAIFVATNHQIAILSLANVKQERTICNEAVWMFTFNFFTLWTISPSTSSLLSVSIQRKHD